MKHLNLILHLLILSFLVSCEKKEVAPIEPIDQLPFASTSGMNTIGCLVNGKALVPKVDKWMDVPSSCHYQYLKDSFGEGYYFNVSARNYKDNPFTGIWIQSQFLEMEEGKTYPLTSEGENGKAHAFYKVRFDDTNSVYYYTNETHKGEMTITRLDRYEQIISGTFWFDAVNERGEKVEVREGRFDMKYVK